jgi:hypothetical protein
MKTRLPWLLVPTLALLLTARPARAEPWFGWGDNQLEDRYEDGDIDVEDLVEGTHASRRHGGSQKLRVGSWLSLGGFFRIVDEKQDVGLYVLVGVALDKVTQGPVHRIDEPRGPVSEGALFGASFADGPTPSPAHAAVATDKPPPLLVTPLVARHAVTAAWKTSALGVDDARIDSMVARARASAALPETRLRAMKVVADSSKLGVIPTDSSTYDIAGANLYLEGRLTWRLDRLLYADDEPTLEKTRLDRQDARERIAGRVVDSLFQWQRALIAERGALVGSKEASDASLRLAEAEAALDILTGGWFGGWVARQGPLP